MKDKKQRLEKYNFSTKEGGAHVSARKEVEKVAQIPLELHSTWHRSTGLGSFCRSCTVKLDASSAYKFCHFLFNFFFHIAETN